ncbi:uncharacterized protein BX663DRAFT_526325 [Cokeromyces recurvatus]|uniref:uncharacterized protein n=1 Tax=Cokeromyces recurvatus TaxID=90255 RepID=UPI002220FA69|nr:uncharacterized protein BX663DRAFT_526325 [Cokeromyces recurvatus]KAI7898014.1 hypothetical protein BX663DRAFT_526325 [Cokeromyces recurvatus]
MEAYHDERTTLLPTTTATNDSINQISQRKGLKYYLIWLWRFCIFTVTGSSSVHVTSMLLRLLHYKNDTWFYYIVFFFMELVVYTIMIVAIGSLLFQWQFFCMIAFKMWSWLLPQKMKIWCYEHLHSHRITL